MYIQKAPTGTHGRAHHGPKMVLAAFMLIMMLLIASLPTGAVFSKLSISSLTWNPTKPQPGDNADATITVTNTGSSEVKIKWIGIHFDWQKANSYVYEDHNAAPISIAAQGQYVFVLLVSIPIDANFTVHPYSVKINYDSGSSQYSETSDTQYDFTLVKYVPPVTKPLWDNPIFLVMLVLIVVAVLLVVVMVVVRQRRLAKEAAKKHLEMRSCVTASTDTSEYELARTVTKDKHGPMRVDHKPRHWETPKNDRITGEATKPPIYRLLGKAQEPQPMPQSPPQAQPMAPPQLPPPPPPPPSGAPQPMPAKPPPRLMPGQPPRGPSSLPPPVQPAKEQATLHQCAICGKMNKATDTTCPKCGGTL